MKCPICGQNMIRCALPRNNYTFGWTCGGKASKNPAKSPTLTP